MEENKNYNNQVDTMDNEKSNKNHKKNIFFVIISILTVSITIISLCLLYNLFCRQNKEVIQTISEHENIEENVFVKIEENEDKEKTSEQNEEKIEDKEEVEEKEKTEEELKAEQEQKEKEKKELEEKLKKQEEEKKKKAEEEKINYAKNYKYYIKVNYTANTVTIYTLDSNGEYTVPVKAMVCSTGASTPKSGVYKTKNKYRWRLLIGDSYGQYSTRITGQILFHSVPYTKQSEDSLITVYYDRLGITTSLGCIRLTVADAKWIYDNCPLGTQVEFYASSNPGPLGKPSAKKITSYGEPLNKWDPTDPNANNPWKNYNSNNNVIEAPQEEENKTPVQPETPKEEENKIPSQLETPKEEENKTPVQPETPKEEENKTPAQPEIPKEEENKTPEQPEIPKEEENKTPAQPETPKEEENKTPEQPETPKEEENKTPVQPEIPKEENEVTEQLQNLEE